MENKDHHTVNILAYYHIAIFLCIFFPKALPKALAIS